MSISVVNSIADLKALTVPPATTTYFVKGYYSPLDGGSGLFEYDPIASIADDGGLVVAPAIGSGRWKRVYDGPLSVKHWGAKGEIGFDNTAPFEKAFAAQRAVVIPKDEQPYETLSLPIYAQVTGLGWPKIKLSVAGLDLGLALKAQGWIKNIDLERFCGTPDEDSHGGHCPAISVGEYYSEGEEFYDFEISGIRLTGTGNNTRNGIVMLGNVHDGRVSDIEVSGAFLIGVMGHWGGDIGAEQITKSWHVRRVVLDGLYIHDLTGNGGAVVFSAAHDITLRNVVAENCFRPIQFTSGDVGGLASQGESAGRVLTGIYMQNITVINFREQGLFIVGRSRSRVNNTFWFAVDENSGVKGDGITLVRGANSTSDPAIDIYFMKNVELNGVNIYHKAGVLPAEYAPALYIHASSGIKISGNIAAPKGARIESAFDVNLEVNFKSPAVNNNPSSIGVEILGDSASVTLGGALALNATSIKLSSTNGWDIVPGTRILSGSHVIIATGSALRFPHTYHPVGATYVTIPIEPSPVALSNGATVTLERTSDHIVIDKCSVQKYYYGVAAVSNAPSAPRNLVVSKTRFDKNGSYDVWSSNAEGLIVTGNTFDRGNRSKLNGGANVRIDGSTRGITVTDNIFEPTRENCEVAYHIYLRHSGSDVTQAAVIAGNQFHGHGSAPTTKAAVYFGTGIGGTEMQHIVADNFFAATCATKVGGSGSAASNKGSTAL